MLRFLLFASIFVLSVQAAFAEPFRGLKRDKYDFYGKRRYHIAAHVTNPLGAGSKGGGGLEFRNKDYSYYAQYTKFWGGYPGTQYMVEYDKFIPSRSNQEFFIFLKGYSGDATFDNKKLSLFGQTDEIIVGPRTYGGGGFGFGRRTHKKVLYYDWRVGVKYTALTPIDSGNDVLDKAMNAMFRLFYFTGPGSILDVHFTCGLQL